MAFRNITNSTTEVVQSTKQLFDCFDFDRSRTLSPESLQKGFEKFGVKLSSEEMDGLFNSYDHDGNGKICLGGWDS